MHEFRVFDNYEDAHQFMYSVVDSVYEGKRVDDVAL